MGFHRRWYFHIDTTVDNATRGYMVITSAIVSPVENQAYI